MPRGGHGCDASVREARDRRSSRCVRGLRGPRWLPSLRRGQRQHAEIGSRGGRFRQAVGPIGHRTRPSVEAAGARHRAARRASGSILQRRDDAAMQVSRRVHRNAGRFRVPVGRHAPHHRPGHRGRACADVVRRLLRRRGESRARVVLGLRNRRTGRRRRCRSCEARAPRRPRRHHSAPRRRGSHLRASRHE